MHANGYQLNDTDTYDSTEISICIYVRVHTHMNPIILSYHTEDEDVRHIACVCT